MTVDTDQKYQEIFEASSKMICQMKQRYHLNRGHDEMYKPYEEKFLHLSSYPLLESMGFYTDISDGVAKIRAATILGDIVRLDQRTEKLLKYVHTNSNYGRIVAIPASDTQEYFSRASRDKGWVEKNLLRSSYGKGGNKAAMAQYLSNFFLRNMKMKQFLPLLNVGFLSSLL